MNPYDLLISKLKAMQIQGFKYSDIVEIWREEKIEIINFLEKELTLALLSGNKNKIRAVRTKILNMKTLDKLIIKGLLE